MFFAVHGLLHGDLRELRVTELIFGIAFDEALVADAEHVAFHALHTVETVAE